VETNPKPGPGDRGDNSGAGGDRHGQEPPIRAGDGDGGPRYPASRLRRSEPAAGEPVKPVEPEVVEPGAGFGPEPGLGPEPGPGTGLGSGPTLGPGRFGGGQFGSWFGPRSFGGGRVQVWGCSPGCLIVSLVLSLLLTLLLNAMFGLFS